MPRPPAPLRHVQDLELLLVAHHPLVFVETQEEDRAEVILEHVADRQSIPYLSWDPVAGLRPGGDADPIPDTKDPVPALDVVLDSPQEMLVHLRGFAVALDMPAIQARITEVHRRMWRNRGAVVMTGPSLADLPPAMARLFTSVRLAPPSDEEYREYLAELMRDLVKRKPIRVDISPEDAGRLVQRMRGLTFFEVKKVFTQAIVENWRLDRAVVDRVLEAKQQVIQRSGVLELTPVERTLSDVAGLENLKEWLGRRRVMFAAPGQARQFGLSSPRGMLLLGVPGCGKSLCARAVASEFGLPLVRLDPARLYQKYIGETEANLRLAIRTSESMAPVVLFIDEIEKAFNPGQSSDSGVSQRVFGTFLSWMQDKPDDIFVVATSNDIENLPPELLRKGRFDEIFFVDLPNCDVRRDILDIHLQRRQRDPRAFDLGRLATESEGFSGAELEQAVVSALYAAYADGVEVETEHLLREVRNTKPLSVTMGERIARLRAWADGRAVRAGT
ncbi:MAG: AAA family ATPase [Myxococcota bacterium]